jgi:hypothetical protein
VAVQQTATFYLYSRSGIGQADCFKVTVAPGGGSFAIRISFMRPVFYSTGGKTFTKLGITWNLGGTGYAP